MKRIGREIDCKECGGGGLVNVVVRGIGVYGPCSGCDGVGRIREIEVGERDWEVGSEEMEWLVGVGMEKIAEGVRECQENGEVVFWEMPGVEDGLEFVGRVLDRLSEGGREDVGDLEAWRIVDEAYAHLFGIVYPEVEWTVGDKGYGQLMKEDWTRVVGTVWFERVRLIGKLERMRRSEDLRMMKEVGGVIAPVNLRKKRKEGVIRGDIGEVLAQFLS